MEPSGSKPKLSTAEVVLASAGVFRIDYLIQANADLLAVAFYGQTDISDGVDFSELRISLALVLRRTMVLVIDVNDLVANFPIEVAHFAVSLVSGLEG
jgi:hypothetical protein